MVGGSAQRLGRLEPVETGQERVEPGAVFQREHARQPAPFPAVDGEPGLETGDTGIAAESGHGLAQLVRLRPVFGVEHHQEFAAREMQGVIAGLRLGARQARRHRNDLVRRIGRGRRQGFLVVGFHHQLDVQPFGRIVDGKERVGELRQHRRLVIERHQDRIDGKTLFARRVQGGALASQPGQDQAQPQAGDKTGRHRRHQDLRHCRRPQAEAEEEKAGGAQQHPLLPGGDDLAGGQLRLRFCQARNGGLQGPAMPPPRLGARRFFRKHGALQDCRRAHRHPSSGKFFNCTRPQAWRRNGEVRHSGPTEMSTYALIYSPHTYRITCMAASVHYKSTVASRSYQHDLIDAVARHLFLKPLRNAAVAGPRCQARCFPPGRTVKVSAR
jgi:hypothetical protein